MTGAGLGYLLWIRGHQAIAAALGAAGLLLGGVAAHILIGTVGGAAGIMLLASVITAGGLYGQRAAMLDVVVVLLCVGLVHMYGADIRALMNLPVDGYYVDELAYLIFVASSVPCWALYVLALDNSNKRARYRAEESLQKLSEAHARQTTTQQELLAAQDALTQQVERARRQQQVLLELGLREELHGSSLEVALRAITKQAGDHLNTERTGVWTYSEDRSEIRCLVLYERSSGHFSGGTTLSKEDYPRYFAALAQERAIAAHNAHEDTRTNEFSEGYLTPLGISSMLDAPIRGSGQMLGVICHEHVGAARAWTEQEQSFAASISDFVAIVLASSEKRRMQERLLQSQKLESVGLLAGGIAHDFNNILTTILGSSSLALSQLSAEEPAAVSLKRVVLAAERAADLTRQILAYSGRGHYDIKPLQLSTVATEMSSLLRASLPKKVKLCLELAPDLPAVEADQAHLQQILMNLLINGGEAIGDATGTLTIRTGQIIASAPITELVSVAPLPHGPYVFLEVEDTGHGMDEHTTLKIFDPYFSTKFAGRGLGLASAAGIVRSLKGGIRVRSTPGKGSTFTVFLPTTDLIPNEDKPVQYTFAGQGLALVIDDEESVRSTVRTMLEDVGYDVLIAENGQEGLDVIRRQNGNISLVLLDQLMPVLGGDEALVAILETAPEMPIVLMSGYGDSEAFQSDADSDRVRFLQKPFNKTHLCETLLEIMPDPAVDA